MSLSSLGLDAFTEAARARHFTKAAAKLHITQSALSQRIAALENELKTKLIIRDRAGIRLTPGGERLFRYTQTRESLELEVVSELGKDRGNEPSVLRVGAFSSVMRSLVLPSIAATARGSQCQISVFTLEMYQLTDLLKSGEADVILTTRQIEGAGIESTLLGYEENVLVKARKIATSDAFFLDHDEPDPTTENYFKKYPTNKPKVIKRRFLDEVYSLMDGVRAGLGQDVLPKHILKGDPDFKVIQPQRTLKVPVWMHRWASQFELKAHDTFIRDLKTRARAALANAE